MFILIMSFVALAIIIYFIVFAAKKKAKGERLGEREPAE